MDNERTMREKLIDIVEAYADFLDWETKDYIVDSIMELFATDNNVGDKLTPTEPKWIPVTERLPEDSVAVNLHTSSGVVGTGFYCKQTKSWVQWYSGGSLFADVTHWMPLPEPPKTSE